MAKIQKAFANTGSVLQRPWDSLFEKHQSAAPTPEDALDVHAGSDVSHALSPFHGEVRAQGSLNATRRPVQAVEALPVPLQPPGHVLFHLSI